MVSPVTLVSSHVQLTTLDGQGLAELARLAQEPGFWQWSPVDGNGLDPERWFQQWKERAMEGQRAGRELPFLVRHPGDGRVLGTTRYLNITPEHRRLEIGFTYYQPSCRGTQVNPACKLLLLRHAFETLGCVRVELKCDARNATSRAAILKLGARQEGVLRKHMILGDGYVRDTVYFSILAEEWPSVLRGLERRLTTGS